MLKIRGAAVHKFLRHSARYATGDHGKCGFSKTLCKAFLLVVHGDFQSAPLSILHQEFCSLLLQWKSSIVFHGFYILPWCNIDLSTVYKDQSPLLIKRTYLPGQSICLIDSKPEERIINWEIRRQLTSSIMLDEACCKYVDTLCTDSFFNLDMKLKNSI